MQMGMMTNTAVSFKDKWFNNKDLVFTDTQREESDIFNWILNRNGFDSSQELRDYLSSKKRVLDGGCGNGRVTALLRSHSNPETTEVVGIDLVASSVARENLSDAKNVAFFEKDLLTDLTDLGKFDFIYCQEVLHHTADPAKGFHNLCQLLEPGSEIAIYVYKQKAPVREYVDDYIREKIAPLPYEEAMKVCAQVTELGKALSETNFKVRVPAVDVLEIKEGEYDLQRFIYHFFMKCFWNPEFSFDANNAINYDWYHPQLCSRHTRSEVRQWFLNEGLTVQYEFDDFYGITIRGKRPN